MLHTITIAFHFFVSELWPFVAVLLILCNFHSCSSYDSVMVMD